jgi:hypothetical protein
MGSGLSQNETVTMRIHASPNAGLDLRQRQNVPSAPQAADRLMPPGLPAVIPANARPSPAPARSNRPVSALIAQLIASAEDMPATRARRRADPSIGAESYRAVAGLGPALPYKKARLV